MKIQYCSDLHLEFSENYKWLTENQIKPIGEILIVAGDTIYINKENFKHPFFDWLSDHFEEVYLIPGNHEYYGGFDIENAYPKLELEIRKNVVMLNNTTIQRGNNNLIFSTLWSNLKRNVGFINLTMADFNFIKRKGQNLLTDDYNELFQTSLKFLSTSLTDSDKTNIVITHHLPSPLCYNSDLKDIFLEDAYYTNLEDFIKSHPIQYWIHGHCHWNREAIQIGNTLLLTNQLGYVHQGEHYSFASGKCINL